jgi:hypothetical protein
MSTQRLKTALKRIVFKGFPQRLHFPVLTTELHCLALLQGTRLSLYNHKGYGEQNERVMGNWGLGIRG